MKFASDEGEAESGSRSGAKGDAAANGTSVQLAAIEAIFRPETNEKHPLPLLAEGASVTPTGIEPVSRP